MTAIKCDKHGTSAAVFICKHLYDEYHHGQIQSEFKNIVEIIYDDVGHDHKLCLDCIKAYGLTDKDSVDDMPEAYFQENKSVCALCFDEKSQ